MLHALWRQGYRYLAAETFDDRLMKAEFKYPDYQSGFYLRDPVFAFAIRTARSLGYKLIAYETQERGPTGDSSFRDRKQAENLKARIFDQDPHAKALIIAGRGHASEEAAPDGWTPMASVLKRLTGINPLTLYAPRMSQRLTPDEEDPFYRFAASHGLVKEPTIFENRAEDRLLGSDRGDLDAYIFWPRIEVKDGRPDWMTRELGRKPIKIPRRLLSGRGILLVQVFKAGEPASAIAVDQVIIDDRTDRKVLMLPKGKFWLRAVDQDSRLIGETTLATDHASEMNRFMTTLHQRGQFNGSLVVAIGGKAIYRSAFGEADFHTHRRFTPETISNIGSVAKQFTATTIMMLAEQHKINYDDPVSKYIPELSKTLPGITLRQLLNHTSGIPDIGDLGIDHPRLTNAEVLQRLSQPNSVVSKPGDKYRYSNPNYVLLAVVVERVSGRRFEAFLTDKILRPLGMHNTFVLQGPRATQAIATAYEKFGNVAGDDVLLTGSSGMYSTVDDLLKWDQALYTEKLVRQSTLSEAFTPGRVKEGSSTYGFGWNIGEQDRQKHPSEDEGFNIVRHWRA